MISSFFKAIGQIPDPDFRSVMGRSLLYAIGIFVLLLSFTWWLIVSSRFFGIGWLEWIVDFVGGATAVVVAFLLFPGAMMFVVSLMLEKSRGLLKKNTTPTCHRHSLKLCQRLFLSGCDTPVLSSP